MAKFLSALAITALLGILLAPKAMADEVFTNQGDRISGTVNSVSDGKLMLHSDAAGDVVIPLSHIRTFSTDKPILVQFADGSQISTQVGTSDAGNITLINQSQTLSISNIDQINPHPFTASVQVGAILTRGNTFTDSINASAALGYTVRQEHFTLTGEYLFGRQKTRNTNVTPVTTSTTTTTDRWEVEGKYEHFFTKKFYGYVDVDATKDRIALLQLRLVPSIGVGYKFFDTGPLKLSAEAGAAFIYEEFTNNTTTQTQAALQLAYHLTYDFNPHIALFNDLTYFPSVDHISNFLVAADVGFHVKLTAKLFTELKIEWNYDAQPAHGALKNDERYIASLGYSL